MSEVVPEVLRWIPPRNRGRFDAAMSARDWLVVLHCTPEEHMQSLFIDLVCEGYMSDALAAVLLGGVAIERGNDPRLKWLLSRLRDGGNHVRDVDRPTWERVVGALPSRLTVYRGTAEPSTGRGIHWTPHRHLAASFACRHAHPLLLSASVEKRHLCGLLTRGGVLEQSTELLILPADLHNVTRTPVSAAETAEAANTFSFFRPRNHLVPWLRREGV